MSQSPDEALRLSERRFRTVFEMAFEFIGLLRTDGTLLEANQAPLHRYGLTKADVHGTLFWDLPGWRATSPDTQESLRTAIATAAQGQFIRYEVEVPAPNGELRTYDFSLMPVKDEAGQVIEIIPEGRDITERKRMEQDLREANSKLVAALDEIKVLRGLIPICSWCKKIRDDQSQWHTMEEYISARTEVLFSHEICPACFAKTTAEFEKGRGSQ